MRNRVTGLLVLGALVLGGGCASAEAERCGPTRAVVARVVDGDTVELASGERVRYLLVDTPESTTEKECWGEEAKEANRSLVEGQEVDLGYDTECTDRFGRLLAYVSLNGRSINELLVERGHACVLFIPPSGETRLDAFEAAEESARGGNKGLWAACDPAPC